MATVTFTDSNAGVWFGFTDNTIMVLDGTNIRVFSPKDGVQVGTIKAIRRRDRNIWIVGERGLAVLDGNRFRAVIPADGEAFRGVSGLEEASDGALWLSEPRGVVFIPGAEISKALKDPSTRVQYEIFDARDGLPGVIQQFRPYPTSVRGRTAVFGFLPRTALPG